MNLFKGEFDVKQDKAKEKVDSMKNNLKDIKSLLDETGTELKMLQSMKVRHNADKVVYDQRKFDL